VARHCWWRAGPWRRGHRHDRMGDQAPLTTGETRRPRAGDSQSGARAIRDGARCLYLLGSPQQRCPPGIWPAAARSGSRGVSSRDPNRWAALSYSVGLLSGVIVLSVEKTDSYVRFHAWQSVLAFAVVAAVSMLLPTVPVVGGWGVTQVAFRVSLVALYVTLIIQALRGERYKLPLIGDLAA